MALLKASIAATFAEDRLGDAMRYGLFLKRHHAPCKVSIRRDSFNEIRVSCIDLSPQFLHSPNSN